MSNSNCFSHGANRHSAFIMFSAGTIIVISKLNIFCFENFSRQISIVSTKKSILSIFVPFILK